MLSVKAYRFAEPKAKATVPGTKVSAGYLSLVNQSDSDIVFVAARSDACQLAAACHHMVMENSRMSMRQEIRDIPRLPAHGQFDLTPGG
ncbi:copper chaperone PCu(A)C [Vibrio metschnikovii]